MTAPQLKRIDAFVIDPREAKLPAWARHELSRLRANCEYANGKLVAMHAGASEVALWGVDADVPLPPGSTVVFKVGEVRIRCHVRDRRLNVNGDEAIAVLPGASNDVQIVRARS